MALSPLRDLAPTIAIRLLIWRDEGEAVSTTIPLGHIRAVDGWTPGRAGCCRVWLVGEEAPWLVLEDESSVLERLGWREG